MRGEVVLLLLFALVAVTAGTCYLARWVLKPLFRAAKVPPPKTQFFLTDIYILIAQLALVGTLMSASANAYQRNENLALMLAFWLALGVLWGVGVRLLSRAEVKGGWQRAVSLGLTIPMAYAGSFLVCSLFLPLLIGAPGGLALLFLGFFYWFVFVRYSSEWVVNGVPPAN